jgi:7,8-dihydro-6-hydroxymethylpterin dimethyltransferase
LDIRALKKSCIHFATADGKMIPFESYNLFYRDEKQQLLGEIRTELATSFKHRTKLVNRASKLDSRIVFMEKTND